MNEAKWDAFGEGFASGAVVPANGWEAWAEQAVLECATIREAMPDHIDTLVEVGCGVGRLTPYLGIMFPNVIATDTSAACRLVTLERCRKRRNVRVVSGLHPEGDAALVWHLYDEDWTDEAAAEHLYDLCTIYPTVLFDGERAAVRKLGAGWSVTTRHETDIGWVRIDHKR